MNICLERAYGLIGQDDSGITINKIKNPHLKNAVIFIESHYPESITSALRNKPIISSEDLRTAPVFHTPGRLLWLKFRTLSVLLSISGLP